MAKITLSNGAVFEGTAKECAEFQKACLSDKISDKPKSGKGSGAAKEKALKSLQDFEAKKGADGEYVWKSYKAQRMAYCYYVATKGKATSSNECYKQGIEFDSIKADYEKAKAEYSEKFVYKKKADR